LRALVQRVAEASVTIDGVRISAIGPGLLILVGVRPQDTEADAAKLADRCVDLRIFADAAKPMNRSVADVGGDVLVVSQFTLAANTTSGRRPSFDSAAPPQQANHLYEAFVAQIRARLGHVETGRFGADMQVALVNDGPVTFLLDVPDRG
jgi:D-tyrosyl-tRNA(Tyr) deacylase